MAKTINATKDSITFPLTNTQLELLRIFSFKLKSSEQKELKQLLNDFADKIAQKRVDEAVASGNWVKLQKAKAF